MAALGTLQSVTAIADSIQLCYQGYCYASEFIHSMREMGEDIAELEQRYREEEFRMWAFALGHNLVIDEKHSRNAEYLNNLPPYWVSTVHQRFLQATKHMKDVEKIVDRYVSKKAPSLQQPISNNGRGSTFHPKTEPLEKSANFIGARSSSEKHVVFLQKSSLKVKVCWSLHDKKKLYDIICRLERDNDILWNMTEPSLLISMCDAVSSKMSFTDLETFAVRTTSSKIDSQDAAQKQEYERRVKEQGQARNYIAGLDKESKDQKISRRIDLSCFQEILNAKLPDQRTRTSTTYLFGGNEMEVLVKWKEWDENIISRDDVIARVSDIVAILKSPPSSLSKILTSVGFLEGSRSNSRRTKWIGIVYDISPFGNHYKIRTLRDLLT